MSRALRSISAAVIAGSALAAPVLAQSQTDELTQSELLQALDERDAIIADLLRRVEALEGAAGQRTAEPARTSAPPQAPVSAAAETATAAPAPPQASISAAAAVEAPDPSEPGRVVADEDAAERALERSLVETGALLLEPGQVEVTPGVTYSYSEADAVVALDDGGPIAAGCQVLRQETLQAELDLRFGLPFQAQGELSLPYRQIDRTAITSAGFAEIDAGDDRTRGFGDFSIGLAKALAREEGWRPDLVGRVIWDVASDGDGGDALSFQLNATKRLDPVVFAGAVGYTHAFSYDGVRSGQSFGYSLTALLAASPETSLRLGFSQSFVGEAEREDGTMIRSDYVTVNLNLGASVILGPRSLLDVGGSIGLTDDSPDFAIRISVPTRFDY